MAIPAIKRSGVPIGIPFLISPSFSLKLACVPLFQIIVAKNKQIRAKEIQYKLNQMELIKAGPKAFISE